MFLSDGWTLADPRCNVMSFLDRRLRIQGDFGRGDRLLGLGSTLGRLMLNWSFLIR
jgi:hypothetical protein